MTENQKVRAGEELVRLDGGDFEINVAQAEAQLAQARLQVEALGASYGKAAADVRTSRTTAAFERSELARQGNLFKAGLISQQDLDKARNTADVAARNEAAAMEAQANALANLGGSPTIPWRQHYNHYRSTFPLRDRNLLIVVDAPTRGRADELRPRCSPSCARSLNAASPLLAGEGEFLRAQRVAVFAEPPGSPTSTDRLGCGAARCSAWLKEQVRRRGRARRRAPDA